MVNAINILYFKNFEDFVDNICLMEDDCSINIIAKYDDSREIIHEFVLSGYEIASITEFGDVDFNGYSDEYIISLCNNEIWVSPAKRENKYVNIETDICFVLDDCNSKILSKTEANDIFEVFIDNDYHYNEHCCKKCHNCEEFSLDDDIFESKECFVNDKNISKEEYHEAIKDIFEFLNFASKFVKDFQ